MRWMKGRDDKQITVQRSPVPAIFLGLLAGDPKSQDLRKDLGAGPSQVH